MPKVALADTLREWDSLLAAVESLEEEMPALPRHVEQLREIAEEVRRIAALRRKLAAELQVATQELRERRQEGAYAVCSIRSLLKAHFGPRSVGLVLFGIRLRRPRRHRTAPEAPPQEPAPLAEPFFQEA